MKQIELEELSLSDLMALHTVVANGMASIDGYSIENLYTLSTIAFKDDKWKEKYNERKLQLIYVEEAIKEKVSRINYE